MKSVLNILMSACLLAGGAARAAETAKASTQKAPAAAKAAPAAKVPSATTTAATATRPTSGPVQIPKTAREIEPGLFEAKDAAGKTWHYTRTPFGVRKFPPQKPAENASLVADEADRILSAVDEGGKVSFERKTPFGTARWSKNRADLNEAEKLALRRASQTRAGSVRKSTTTNAAAAKPAAQE